MDSDGTFSGLDDLKESSDYSITRSGSVDEEQVMMIEPLVRKAASVVDLLIESNHCRDIVFTEIREVRLGGVQWITCRSVGRLNKNTH